MVFWPLWPIMGEHIRLIFPMTYHLPDYNKVSVSAHMIHGIKTETFYIQSYL